MTEITTINNTAIQVQQQPTMTVADMVNDFAAYIAVQDITKKSYGVALRAFLDWTNENGVQHPVKREDILAYKEYLTKPHPKRPRCDRPNSKPGAIITYSAGTQARYFRVVGLLFRWAVQRGIYERNPADNIKGAKVKADNRKRDALEDEQARKVLNSIDRSTLAGKRDYAMCMLGIMNGLRIIEMQRANVGSIETVSGRKILNVWGKGHDSADDFVKLLPETYEAIADYLEARGNPEDEAPLFAGIGNRSRGKRLTEPSISRIIKERLRDAGFDSRKLTAHSLRHTAGTEALRSGAPLQQVQHFMRHASPVTTENVYAHNIDKLEDDTSRRVYNRVFGIKTDTVQQIAEAVGHMTEDKQQIALQMILAMAA